MLESKLLSGNQRLRDCEIKDPSHVVPGERGRHVGLIQQALILIDKAVIAQGELTSESYGPSTAKAVLNYKTARSIINRSYQQSADNIVGKLTIKRLDEDMLKLEASPAAGDMKAAMLRPFLKRLT